MNFLFFWSNSADAAYFILQAAGLSAKKLDFFLEILTYCHKIKMSRVLQLKKIKIGPPLFLDRPVTPLPFLFWLVHRVYFLGELNHLW